MNTSKIEGAKAFSLTAGRPLGRETSARLVISGVVFLSVFIGGLSFARAQNRAAPLWYVYGHPILRPYELELIGERVLLNGVVVHPRRVRPRAQIASVAEQPAQAGRMYEATQILRSIMESQDVLSLPVEQQFLIGAQRARVELPEHPSVTILDGRRLNIVWSDGRGFTYVPRASVPKRKAEPRDEARKVFEGYSENIARGDLVVISSYSTVETFPGVRGPEYLDRVRAEFQNIRNRLADVSLDELHDYFRMRIRSTSGALIGQQPKPGLDLAFEHVNDPFVAYELAHPAPIEYLRGDRGE